MAQLTFTIPDAIVSRVIQDLATFYGIVEPDPQIRTQMVKQAIASELKAHCLEVERESAQASANANVDNTVTQASSDISIG